MREKGKQNYLDRKHRVEKEIKKKKSFRRIFLGISVSMLLVVLTASFVLYEVVRSLLIEQNIQTAMRDFEEIQADFEEANEAANMIATQVFLDDLCSDFLNDISGEGMDSILRNRIRSQLTTYENTNSAVESIYLYNGKADLFIPSGTGLAAAGKEEFSDQSIVSMLEAGKGYRNYNLIRRERVSTYYNGMERNETLYSYILYSSYEDRSAVVVNLKFHEMFQRMLEMESMRDSKVSVLDHEDHLLAEIGTLEAADNGNLLENVREMKEKGEWYREETLDGKRYVISYLHSDQTDWDYVKVTDWESMFYRLENLKAAAAVFLFILTAAVLLIALGNSVSILRLHRSMETKPVIRTGRMDLNRLRDQFLNDFLHGRKIFGRDQLRNSMERFLYPVEENALYTVLVLQIEKYGEFCELFGAKGTWDMKFGIQNIFEETYGRRFRTRGLINRDHTISFLVETKEDRLGLWEEITELFGDFCENVRVFIDWDFFLLGTAKQVNLERIPELNGELKKVGKESFFYPVNLSVTMERIRKEHGSHADLHKLGVDELIREVRQGGNARERFLDIEKKLSSCRMEEYMNIMMWIGLTLTRSLGERGFTERSGSEFLLRLSKCQKQTETESYFFGIFREISEHQIQQSEKKGVVGRIDEVKRYIDDHFLEPGLTLEQIGDTFGISPNYLGRLFKKDAGMSVSDYINGKRLEKVLKELEDTDRPAKEIAEECGFVGGNYFYTYFRKKVGVTPQVYRQNIREGKDKT